MTPTIYPDRASWLAGRQNTIGASDVAVIMGVNRFKSAYTLYQEKSGAVDGFSGNIATRVGLALEKLIAQFYCEETGVDPFDAGDYTVFAHPDMPYFGCTPDRLILRKGDTLTALVDCEILKAVELKSMGEYAARKHADEPPLEYEVQTQAQMACLECESADLAVLIGNRSFGVFPQERNDRFIKVMLSAISEFWDRVQNEDPPPVDSSDSTYETIKAMHPDDNGRIIQLPEKAVFASIALDEIKGQIKQLEEQEQAAKVIILDAMGDATFGDLGDGTFRSWKTQTRKGELKVDPAFSAILAAANVPFKVTEESKFRVLRTTKNVKGK